MAKEADIGLIKAALKASDDFLNVFKTDLSPTSLEAIGDHIAEHTIDLLRCRARGCDLIPILIGLCIRCTCDKEVQAFLKAEEAADAAQDK